jgi:hypothetical protein
MINGWWTWLLRFAAASAAITSTFRPANGAPSDSVLRQVVGENKLPRTEFRRRAIRSYARTLVPPAMRRRKVVMVALVIMGDRIRLARHTVKMPGC